MPIADQTWIELRRMIQESFQRWLNATAPTVGGQGYAPTFNNAFGALQEASNDNDSVATTVATQVAALTYQSQLTASTAATSTQRQEQQLAHFAAVQDATHATLHQIIEGLNAVAFNVSDAVGRNPRYEGGSANGRGRSTRGGRFGGRGRAPFTAQGTPTHQNAYPGNAVGGVPPYRQPAQVFTQPLFAQTVGHPSGPQTHCRFGPPGFQTATGQQGIGQSVQQQPYSNTVKRYSNWNACYLCGFDVADGHTSISCPPHLCKASHDINFNRQNAQQYIDLGHPCATKGRHKTQFPASM